LDPITKGCTKQSYGTYLARQWVRHTNSVGYGLTMNVWWGSDDSGCYDTVFWCDDVQMVHVLQQPFIQNPQNNCGKDTYG